MKKIISLLSVFAMIATMFTTVAFADANNDFYFTESVNGNEVKLTLYGKTDSTVIQLAATVDIANAINNGATVKSFKALNGLTFNVNSTQKVITCTYMDTSASTGQTGVFEFGEVIFDITNLKEDSAFAQKRAVVAKELGGANIASKFSSTAYSYVLKAPAAEEVLPADRTAISDSFEAVVGDYVEITLTNKGTKTYALPSGVKGGSAKVAGMLKYTVNAEDANAPAKGDVFTGFVKNINDAEKAVEILNVTVE